MDIPTGIAHMAELVLDYSLRLHNGVGDRESNERWKEHYLGLLTQYCREWHGGELDPQAVLNEIRRRGVDILSDGRKVRRYAALDAEAEAEASGGSGTQAQAEGGE